MMSHVRWLRMALSYHAPTSGDYPTTGDFSTSHKGIWCKQVKPEVDAALQGQLEAMGFSANKAVRALHFTGTSSLEQAVAWLVEHGEDADIDTPLLIPKVWTTMA